MNKQTVNWISNALASSRNQSLPGALGNVEVADQSEAEYFLAIGKIVANRRRRGVEVETIASIINADSDALDLAQAFAKSSPALIFKALVEDWSFEKILGAIRKSRTGPTAV